ncbi:YdeI/OmpD-associated family protein [Streptococcus sanguinis]|uniref:YdeI/OmpD-associated family protein n=1 Tax=Streptococcus sanguinis TaxID=1305 RepID=UPI001CC15334|nr:YdeI/OmpD-associated family protein [Streptococcus sanguinis]MBZ2023728.1 YdeI/OmpD-associated family protein [Streptococcus sanguinis]MBZ2048559.1 YdeI/OmpD-associated family protein [Streptococcus sanguinis]MBZ2050924.1 YdeI/OmpD-associated family protein [Streptococcus sanguinis]MBZ2059995.1 YdeI/OmpD-associated family protein [Streptococcus sanguinis]
MTGGTDMSDLSDAILKQVVLELKERLDGPAKERFAKLPPSHQREWARYISEAKKDETKLRRIEKMKVDLLKP